MTSFPEDSRISEETTGSSGGSSHKRAEISPFSLALTDSLHFVFTCPAMAHFFFPSLLSFLVLKLKSTAPEHRGVSTWNWRISSLRLRFHIKRALTGAVFKSNVATTAPSNLQMWQLLDKTIGHEQGDDSLGGGGFLHWRNLSVLLLFVHFLFFIFFAFSHSSTSLSSLGGGGSLCTTTSSPTDSTGETINNHFVCGALVCLAARDAPQGRRIFWYVQKAQWIID